MNKQGIATAVALGISSLWIGVASATVTVKFITPEQFADVRDSGFARGETLAGIEAHLQTLAAAQFASAASSSASGKDLLIEVTDVDRAGELEPWGRDMREVRVLRTVGRPAITLRYVLSEGGHELRRGEARLSDLSYLNRFNRYPSGDPIRFEKRMLDEWFNKEFVVAVKRP